MPTGTLTHTKAPGKDCSIQHDKNFEIITTLFQPNTTENLMSHPHPYQQSANDIWKNSTANNILNGARLNAFPQDEDGK